MPLVKVKVLKEWPQGQEPGQVVEVEEAVALAFETVGAAERYTEPEPAKPARGRSRRFDIRPEGSEG